MTEENIVQEFRLKDICVTINHFIEEINFSKKHKKVRTTLNHI